MIVYGILVIKSEKVSINWCERYRFKQCFTYYGQYDKSIHRLLYKNRDSNNIISLLNKVLNLKIIRNPTNCGVSIGLKIPVKKEQHDFSCSS